MVKARLLPCPICHNHQDNCICQGIPYFNTPKDIKMFKVFMPEEVDEPLLETLHSGYITEGPKVKEFEKAFAKKIGNQYVAAVNSGTSALTLAFRLAGVGPGDEVISSPLTCTATNLPILALGGKIVWADIDPATGLIDPKDVLRKASNKTKAIVFVDWGGTPADLDALMAVGKRLGIKVIEDAAHAQGAIYKGRNVGTFADFTTYSLQAIKHISTIDGGVLACLNKDDWKRAKRLRWFGIDREATGADSRIDQDILEYGYKFHMNDVTATIGLVALKYLDEIVEKQRANADYYNKSLSHLAVGSTDPVDYDCLSSRWLYTILLPKPDIQKEFKEYMKEKGIEVSQVHKRNDAYTVFKPFVSKLPMLDQFASRMICLPVHWGLSEQDLERVVGYTEFFIRSNDH